LLQAWKLVIQNYPDWTLHIYGKSDSKDTFLRLSESLGLSPNVLFSEPVTDIQNVYLSSSIMVLPSRSEGFGMVLIEAMACGLPCVSFDCPHGPADIITYGEDGLLVPNVDVEQLAEAIIDIMKHEHRRQAMGIAAKENVKRYLPEHIVPIWEELFKQLLANK
jgi:glycosyltransferase involved in cell wall biosynthesis